MQPETFGSDSIRWITTGDTIDYWPVFSPDGKSVLFTRGPDDGATLMLISLVTGEVRPFLQETPPGATTQTRPDWSHAKDHRVAFAANNGIWLVEEDGSKPVLLPNTGGMIYPSWYPDGKAMAVMNGPEPATLKIGIDGQTLGPLSPPGLYTGMPSVNQAKPDLLLYPGQPAEGAYDQNNNQLWLTENSGMTASKVEVAQARAPWWSPDGKRAAFESTRSGDGMAVYVATPDASIVFRLTDPAIEGQHPKWSHDGKQIVFVGKPSGSGPGKIALLFPDKVPGYSCVFG